MFITNPCDIRRVGNEAHHHFFGYYNKNIWDNSGRYLLSHRVTMMSADLTGKEIAEVGFFDLENGDVYTSIGTTSAWNWQMGAQLQWLEHRGEQGNNGREIIYNARTTEVVPGPPGHDVYPDFCSVVYNVDTGKTRVYPLPVYVVAPNSRYALSVNYSRFQVTHRTIGYSSTGAEPHLDNAPDDDGIFNMDLHTDEVNLVLSLQDLLNFQPVKSMVNAVHWVTHLEMCPDSSRFLFIHRWTERVEDETCFLHRLFTVNPDGSDLCLLECSDHPIPQLAGDFDPSNTGVFDYEKSPFQISHPTWKDNNHIIVWGPHRGSIRYHLYTDRSSEVKIIGAGTLTENGHMLYSPTDDTWLLTDTYPDAVTNKRLLLLYNLAKDTCYSIGSFYTSPDLGKENRCDLHPRWKQDGTQVCIDSVHESTRQQYIIDVESEGGRKLSGN